MANLSGMLRKGQALSSRMKDIENLSKGNVAPVVKKAINRNAHKRLNTLLRQGAKLFIK